MLVLFFQTIWTLTFLIAFFFIKIFFFKKEINNNLLVSKLLILLFYNKNLNLFNIKLNSKELSILNLQRFNKYPILFLIHMRLNYCFKKPVINKFKDSYKFYKFTNSVSKLTPLDFITVVNFTKKNLITTINLYIWRTSFSDKNLYIISKDIKVKKNLNNYIVFFSQKLKKLKIFIITNKVVNINNNYLNNLSNLYTINFSASNVVKYLSELSISNSAILFLRKNKVFNKSRYSRNRQTYRTGAYWCLYVNIIAVIAFYFWFYNFTINFGYIWWFLYLFILSFVFFKAIKFNLYNPKTLINEIISSIKWFVILINSFKSEVYNLISKNIYIDFLNLIIINYLKHDKKFNFLKQKINFLNKINNVIFKNFN